MRDCRRCPAFYCADGCILRVPEEFPGSLTAMGCMMPRREVEKRLKNDQCIQILEEEE
jgi:hypothetical protein